MLTTIITCAVLAVAFGVFVAVVFTIILRVRKRAKAAGVVLSDGVSSNEAKIVLQLIEEEMKEKATIEALTTLKRVILKATESKGI